MSYDAWLPLIFCDNLYKALEGRMSPNNVAEELARTLRHSSFFQLPSRSLTGQSPSLASWNTRQQHQDVPHGLLVTGLRAVGLTVTAGGQQVPPWLVWWLPLDDLLQNISRSTK